MSASQALNEHTVPLRRADGLVAKSKQDSAFTGIVVGVALSLPIWAAIMAVGEMVPRWL